MSGSKILNVLFFAVLSHRKSIFLAGKKNCFTVLYGWNFPFWIIKSQHEFLKVFLTPDSTSLPWAGCMRSFSMGVEVAEGCGWPLVFLVPRATCTPGVPGGLPTNSCLDGRSASSFWGGSSGAISNCEEKIHVILCMDVTCHMSWPCYLTSISFSSSFSNLTQFASMIPKTDPWVRSLRY